jgi:hypothetical protein
LHPLVGVLNCTKDFKDLLSTIIRNAAARGEDRASEQGWEREEQEVLSTKVPSEAAGRKDKTY